MNPTDMQSSKQRRERGELTPPRPTVVGLGPPDSPSADALLAGAGAYEEVSDPGENQTLVGFPGPAAETDADAPNTARANSELFDTFDDEVTVVGGYDEVTKVTPSDVPAIARLIADAKGVPAAVTLAEPQLAEPETKREAPATSSPSEPPDTLPDPAVDAAAALAAPAPALPSRVSKPPPPPRPSSTGPRRETIPPPSSDRDLFVSRDTELQLFAPPVEMFGPGPAARARFDSLPSPNPSGSVMQSDAPWYTQVEPDAAPAPRSKWRTAAVVGIAAALAGVGLLSGGMLGKTGTVLVTVSGPLDVPVSNAQVFVNGKQVCAPAPCRITLEKGAYVLGVAAPSYRRAAEKSLSVARGGEEALHFTLLPDDSAGIDVKSSVAGLRVFVDGLERGTTPVTVRGLAPGKHSVKLTGNPRYAPFETELELGVDRLTVLEPKLTLEPEAEPVALAELATTPNPPPAANAANAAPTPVTPAPAPEANALLAKLRAGVAPVAAANVNLDTPEPGAAAESAKLTITSSPPSNVVVDGRPLGSTPREVAVTPGDHSVVFVHPSKGRKSVRVRAHAGKTASAAVEF
jgi:hypothetical protein